MSSRIYQSLSKEEWEIIKEHRKKKERDKIIKECSHKWDYKGSSYYDDIYECVICGKREWR